MSVTPNHSYRRSGGCFENVRPAADDGSDWQPGACQTLPGDQQTLQVACGIHQIVTEDDYWQKRNPEIVNDVLVTLKSAATAPEELSAKLTESDKSLEAAHAEVVLLKQKIMFVGAERAYYKMNLPSFAHSRSVV